LRIFLDYIEGAAPNGAGRAEDGDALHQKVFGWRNPVRLA
jgi:hypothetical protein